MIAALTGFMASGKTTFGQAAARQLGWEFIDLDQWIARRFGTPTEIFAAQGEPAFRRLETQQLGIVLQSERDTVLALGGGTILREENLRQVKACATLIWLDTDFDIILSELDGTDRPLVRDKTTDQIRTLYDERRPRYAEAADIRFAVQHRDYGKVIAELAATISAAAAVRRVPSL